jgi:hypothetical protein
MRKKTILLGLNELNFEFIEKYIELGLLPNFEKLFNKFGYKSTISENKYELLEPWIQWVTIHTGKTYEEHKIFRLGDIVDHKNLTQLWNVAEEKGLSVGAISPFNARNDLKNPLFFVPDPWTKTPVAGTQLLKDLSAAASNAVNENANNEVGKSSLFTILKSFLAYVPFTRWFSYLPLAVKVTKPGVKAVIFDSLLGDVFFNQWKKYSPDFSSLFLNTGAHTQHHYMFNASVYEGEVKNPEWYCASGHDPLIIILKEYDKIVGKLLDLPNTRLFIATGLHQNPHNHITYYWRLKNHTQSLKDMGVTGFAEAIPRMSRDFLIKFNSEEDAKNAEIILASYVSAKEAMPIFTVDNRGTSLFIELTYDNEVDETVEIKSAITNIQVKLKPLVSFVAIKNGEHNGIGYFIDTGTIQNKTESIPLKETFSIISNSFSASN